MRGLESITAAHRRVPALLLLLLAHMPAGFCADPEPLDIRKGTVIPKLLWKDNTFKDNLHVIQVTDTHVFLRDDAQVLAIRHEHLISLYQTTHQNLVSSKINQAANHLGGANPGAVRKQHISPGHIFPRLLWINGEEKRLVEVLNIKSGHYVLRVDGKTAALSQEKFLTVLENTQTFLAGGVVPPPPPDPDAKPDLGENPFLVTNLPPAPNFGKLPTPNLDLLTATPTPGKTDKASTPPEPTPAPPPTPGSPTTRAPGTLGPPPAPPASQPTTARPIQFDFTFAGDTEPPTLEK